MRRKKEAGPGEGKRGQVAKGGKEKREREIGDRRRVGRLRRGRRTVLGRGVWLIGRAREMNE